MITNSGRRTIVVAGTMGGGALLAASAGIHVDLYVTGYDDIPTIGTLFLLQAAVGVLLATAGVAGATSSARRLVGAIWTAASLFALGTVTAYAVSRASDLFGFHEVPSTAGVVAGVVEVTAFLAYGLLAVSWRAEHPRPGRATRAPRRGRSGAVAIVAVVLFAVVFVDGMGSGPSTRGATAAPAGGSKGPTQQAATVHVVISDYDYHPDRVVAHPGELIAVTNHDKVTHTMTAIPGSAPDGDFNTGYIDPGATVHIHAPKAPGTYDFYCSIHNFMKGVLVVVK
jgi:plastocyanin